MSPLHKYYMLDSMKNHHDLLLDGTLKKKDVIIEF